MKTYVLGLALVAMGTAAAAGTEEEKIMREPVDIAAFALPNTARNELRFEEPRDIVSVDIEFERPPEGDLGLSYLRKTWPETRVDEAAQGDPCRLGWIPQDDWFNAQWHEAAVVSEPFGGGYFRISFKGLREEFPELADYDVQFRRTLGIRLETRDIDAVRAIHVYTASEAQFTELRVYLDERARPNPPYTLSAYNAVVKLDTELTKMEDGDYLIQVAHMRPAHPYSGDDGLLMFHLADDAFTISLSALETQGPIWYAERGFLITRADAPIEISEYLARHAHDKTLSQRVLERDEQSLASAMFGQPRPHPVSYNVGVTHARQRFWIEQNGDLVLHKRNIEWVRGRDTERFKNVGDARFYFGLERQFISARFPDPEPVLAYNIHARRDGIVVEQKCFAVPLGDPAFARACEGDDTIAALVRFRFHNASNVPHEVRFDLAYSQEAGRAHTGRGVRYDSDTALVPRFPLDAISIEGDRVSTETSGGLVLRALLDTAMSAEARGTTLELSAQLEANGTCEAVLKIPYVALADDDETARLRALSFDACYDAMADYWRKFAADGAHVRTPVPQLDALHEMHPVHVAITDFAMPGDNQLVNTSVGTSTYGNFSNEACMIVDDLDQRGLHEEARRRLAVWTKYQGTVAQPGNFTDHDGMFYGAGGFECGAYNQHHGWVLWGLCEHFFLTGDRAWFDGVADSVIAGADWVFRQRRNTMKDLPHSRGWEYGFLPAGSLEDVTDFYYWLSTNALTWRGTEWAARALEAAGHPQAQRIRREADAYREDLRRGFDTARQYAPLVRLRDGRWVPAFPSRLYCRGRETGWIRETLEGAVYLLISGLYDANGPEAQWILDDYQDNRYPEPPYGYHIEDFEANWFDRGGLSMQPNLLAGLLPHLMRDEPELYIWMFYNAWAACYREEINAMVEHPMPVLGYSNNAHFKTSDQANAMTWLRYMFVYAHDNELWLGRAIPRAWFAQPHPIEIQDANTPYGKVNLRFEPDPDQNRITATLDLDLREKPNRILLRFRHPKKRPIQSITINEAPHQTINPESEDIDLSGREGTLTIEARY